MSGTCIYIQNHISRAKNAEVRTYTFQINFLHACTSRYLIIFTIVYTVRMHGENYFGRFRLADLTERHGWTATLLVKYIYVHIYIYIYT